MASCIDTATVAKEEVSFPSLHQDGNAIAQSCAAVLSESTRASPQPEVSLKPLSNPNPSSSSSSSSDYSSRFQQRNSFKRNNNFPHHRGNGSGNHAYRGKRRDYQDRECGHWEWNNSGRYFDFADRNRNLYIQPQTDPTWGPTPFAPYTGPFTIYRHHQMPNLPSHNPCPYRGSSRAFRPVFHPTAPPPMFHTFPDTELHKKIISQINYYFSYENLVKDEYLRKNMDEQGWVDIKLIAKFKRIAEMTNDIQLIKTAMSHSITVEVKDEKMRRRGDWKRWIWPSSSSSEPTMDVPEDCNSTNRADDPEP